MFCGNCGHKFNNLSDTFCPNCGAKRVGTQPANNAGYASRNYSAGSYNPSMRQSSPTTTNIRMPSLGKKHIAIVGIAVAVIVTIILIVNVDGGNGLRGTWVLQDSYDRYPISIQFNGNRFTTTHYEVENSAVIQADNRGELVLASGWHIQLPWSRNDNASRDLIGYKDVRYPQFQGGWVTRTEPYYRITMQGTYSITGDTIELLFSDGSIQTRDFSQTANTLNFGHAFRFIRR